MEGGQGAAGTGKGEGGRHFLLCPPCARPPSRQLRLLPSASRIRQHTAAAGARHGNAPTLLRTTTTPQVAIKEVHDVLLKYYTQLFGAFVYYAAGGSSDPYHMSLNAFTSFLDDCRCAGARVGHPD
jgi:hypothetical protein